VAERVKHDAGKAAKQQQYGRLPVLLVWVNPDLAMGDALPKATGAGNVFTGFGEPDIGWNGRPTGWSSGSGASTSTTRHRLRRGELLRQAHLRHRS